MAYMVRSIQSSTGKTIYVYALMALDTMFEGIQGDIQIKPNCYASLVELDHFSNELTFGNPLSLPEIPSARHDPRYRRVRRHLGWHGHQVGVDEVSGRDKAMM